MNSTTSEALGGLFADRYVTKSALVPGGISAGTPPPLTDRGVEKTESEGGAFKGKKVDVSLDWLTFTAPIGELSTFLELLGMGDEWTTLGRGMWGYPEAIARGTTKILSGVRGEMCVVCTGETFLELRAGGTSDESFLATVLGVCQNITRLDVAFDAMGATLDLDRVKAHFEAGTVACRFKSWDERMPRRIGTGEAQGRTIYVGSRESESFIRFYDKGLQTGTMPAGRWKRCELELKKDNAMAAARLFASLGMEQASGMLANLLDFKEEDQTDSNKARRRRAGWWDDFLAAAERIRLGIPAPRPTLAKAVAWVKKQVGPTLAAIIEATGGDLAVVHEVVQDGLTRQRAKHRLLASSGMMLGAT